MPRAVERLGVKIFADGANLDSIRSLRSNDWIRGFTTNPTLMRQSGVKNYLDFARQVIEVVSDLPLSLEVFSDDFREMRRQALTLASIGPNVNVKIPVTNSQAESSNELVRDLASSGVSLNVTAIFTMAQFEGSLAALRNGPHSYLSIFAGRIADTGRDPLPIIREAVDLCRGQDSEVIWASPRETLNIIQANDAKCHIITVTPDLLKKLDLLDKELDDFSLDTVKMFARDAQQAGYKI